MAQRVALTAIRRRKPGGKQGEVQRIPAGTLIELSGKELSDLEAQGAVAKTDDLRASKFGFGPKKVGQRIDLGQGAENGFAPIDAAASDARAERERQEQLEADRSEVTDADVKGETDLNQELALQEAQESADEKAGKESAPRKGSKRQRRAASDEDTGI